MRVQVRCPTKSISTDDSELSRPSLDPADSHDWRTTMAHARGSSASRSPRHGSPAFASRADCHPKLRAIMHANICQWRTIHYSESLIFSNNNPRA